MQVNFKCDINEKDIQKEIESGLRKKTIDILNHQILCLFREPGKHDWYSSAPLAAGEMYVKVMETVRNYCNSPETAKKIQDIIERNFDRVLEETTLRAIQHHANRVAFKAVQDKVT